MADDRTAPRWPQPAIYRLADPRYVAAMSTRTASFARPRRRRNRA